MKIQAGQVAVITGAGGGLGSALAVELAKKGCALALVDMSQEALEKTKAKLGSASGKISLHVVNVSDRGQMEALATDVVSQHGSVNLLINNAGITLQKNFSTHSLDDWERIVGVNLWGVIYGCHVFGDALSKAAPAHVVNVASMSSFIGLPAQSSYCATKAAVERLSESLWAEWAAQGIGVTSVHPGAVRTDMIMATLEDSDDVEAARKNYDMAQKMGVGADIAAQKIVRAVERDKRQLLIGKETYLIHYIKRWAPWIASWGMKRISRRQAADVV